MYELKKKKKTVLPLKQSIIKGYQFLNHFSVVINNQLIIHMLTSARESLFKSLEREVTSCPGLPTDTPADCLVKFILKLS